MIEAADVQAIADKIEEATEGRFRAPDVSRPGDRENFIDSNRVVSWKGADRAAAYYLEILRQVAPKAAASGAIAAIGAMVDRLDGLGEPTERGRQDAVYYRRPPGGASAGQEGTCRSR